ncbi:hypothetical protein [Actinomyces oris]|nr:hypothetical protein [Actinomyces oris]
MSTSSNHGLTAPGSETAAQHRPSDHDAGDFDSAMAILLGDAAD